MVVNPKKFPVENHRGKFSGGKSIGGKCIGGNWGLTKRNFCAILILNKMEANEN